ncbi:MAG: hypothetical protein M0Q23_03360 [Syntrophales bacterium]|nr:hypothetical protein [Syntrophales bacterium]MCK9527683.1 hypothetical protein [Syntrophales bacterium]MDX9921662.1 hypothetical protein [Syntrophales bacterium]
MELEKIALLPVQRILPESPEQTFARCPLSGAFLRTCGVPGDGAEVEVESLFVNALRSSRKYVLIPSGRTEGLYKRIRTGSFKEPVGEELKKVGEELGADAVIAGYVFCYRERMGYTYAVEQPASAVFIFHLVRVSDGDVVWSGTFDKTQGSLMTNILDIRTFFKGGGKWITVRELSEQGVGELLKSFPERE